MRIYLRVSNIISRSITQNVTDISPLHANDALYVFFLDRIIRHVFHLKEEGEFSKDTIL
jgi:hypothetical protein